MTNIEWTPTPTPWAPPTPTYAPPPRPVTGGQAVGRTFAVLFAPIPMLWAGALATAVAGWPGFVFAVAATGIALGIAIANTHTPEQRRSARLGYCAATLAWGGLTIGAFVAVLSAISIPSSC